VADQLEIVHLGDVAAAGAPGEVKADAEVKQ